MNTAQLEEKASSLIMNKIKNGIAGQLATLRTDRNNPVVSTEPPKSYFIYEPLNIYQCPAIVLDIDLGSINEEKSGANYVDCTFNMYLDAIVEDQDGEKLTIKAWRYKAALFNLLHWAEIVDDEKNVRLFVRPISFKYSKAFKDTRDSNQNTFRKEVSIVLEVKHYENPF